MEEYLKVYSSPSTIQQYIYLLIIALKKFFFHLFLLVGG